MYYDDKHILNELAKSHVIKLTLGPKDSAWNPASTKRVIYGPAIVSYTEDYGSITADVERKETENG